MQSDVNIEAASTPRRFSESDRRLSWCLVAAAVFLVLLLRVHAFYIAHNEGDEVVYLTLAQSMGWDLSHYTTQDDPIVSAFPYTIYRQPLFFHPPLFPLLLKVGIFFGAPVLIGLLIELLFVVAIVFSAHAAARQFALPIGFEALLLAGIVADPLLLFSSTRLHHDVLAGGLLFCGVILLIKALGQESRGGGVLAGCVLTLTLNSRFNALTILPLLVAIGLFALVTTRRKNHMLDVDAARISLNRIKGVLLAAGTIVLLVGLQHYLRMWLTYGTLNVSKINAPIPELISQSVFLTRLMLRDHVDILRDLLALFPLLLAWLMPVSFKAVWNWARTGSWAWVPVVAVWLLLVAHVLAGSTQTRYYALVAPFWWLGFVLLLHEARGGWRLAMAGLAVLTLLLGVMTQAWLITMGAKTAEVVPFLYRVLPFLSGLAG